MASFEGEYSGAALAGFLKSFESSPTLVAQILARHSLPRVDPTTWYPIDLAARIFTDVRTRTGARILYTAGMKMAARTAPLPAGADLKGVLPMLDERYHRIVRGPKVGGIECSFDDDHGAVLVYRVPFPCAYRRGIVQEYCERCGTPALIEHGASGCIDTGADTCVYRVSW